VKMLVMVAVVLALVFGGAGLATRYARDHAGALVHHVADTQLPSRVKQHAWVPVVRGRAVGANAVRFDGGSVSTVRCHTVLGAYSLNFVYRFDFHRSAAAIRRGCPGAAVRRALGRASKVRTDTSGAHEVLTFLDDQGHGVLTLRARG
jgi:hypothetical protein